MLDSYLKKPEYAYLAAIDKKLSRLKEEQIKDIKLAHSLWECIALLNSAIYNKVKKIEYDLYFDLIKNKIVEYGLANIIVCDITIKEHLEDLKERINQKEIAWLDCKYYAKLILVI